MFILVYLLSLSLLILLSYFFSGMETALTSLNVSKLYDLSSRGDKRAKKVIKLYNSREQVISTILLGNTVVNILSSSIAAGFFVHIFGDSGIFIASLIMTFVILIFAEVLPKTYAINNPEKVALFSTPYIILLDKLFTPITKIIQVSVDWILNALNLKKNRENISARDALRNIIFMHKDSISGNEARDGSLDMVNNVLDLKELDISQVMTHKSSIFAINIDLTISDIVEKITETSHSRVPFWKNSIDNIIGILHVKDLFDAIAKSKEGNYNNIDVRELISEPIFVPDTTTLAAQVVNFRKSKRYMAVVVDEYGVLQGVVTLEDILEEVVGEIHDEHSSYNSGIVSLRNGSYVVRGDVTIRDINRALDLDLPEEDSVSTIAGLIINYIRRIPNEKENFTMMGCAFTILRKEDNRIIVMNIIKSKDGV